MGDALTNAHHPNSMTPTSEVAPIVAEDAPNAGTLVSVKDALTVKK